MRSVTFTTKMVGELGFRSSFMKEALFIKDNGTGDLTFIVSYVDNMLLIDSKLEQMYKTAR